MYNLYRESLERELIMSFDMKLAREFTERKVYPTYTSLKMMLTESLSEIERLQKLFIDTVGPQEVCGHPIQCFGKDNACQWCEEVNELKEKVINLDWEVNELESALDYHGAK